MKNDKAVGFSDFYFSKFSKLKKIKSNRPVFDEPTKLVRTDFTDFCQYFNPCSSLWQRWHKDKVPNPQSFGHGATGHSRTCGSSIPYSSHHSHGKESMGLLCHLEFQSSPRTICIISRVIGISAVSGHRNSTTPSA
jgi:hypothetical protein